MAQIIFALFFTYIFLAISRGILIFLTSLCYRIGWLGIIAIFPIR